MKSLIDIFDLSTAEVDALLELASDIIESPAKYAEACRGKKLATLFFEPSTRTRLSFEAAMYELGGHVIGFSDASSSSATKGESVADTVKVISCYADIIAMRHTREGAPLVASCNATIPVINAGDGGHKHPTQTLADLLTIRREKGRLCDLTVGFCGDLKYGRTVHSLIEALSRYTGIKLVLISPDELKIPGYVKHEVIRKSGMPYVETDDLESALPDLDILYMTRVQKERFADLAVYERLKDSYILTAEKMKAAKEDMAQNKTNSKQQPLTPLGARFLKKHLTDILSYKPKTKVNTRKEYQKSEINGNNAEHKRNKRLFRYLKQKQKKRNRNQYYRKNRQSNV